MVHTFPVNTFKISSLITSAYLKCCTHLVESWNLPYGINSDDNFLPWIYHFLILLWDWVEVFCQFWVLGLVGLFLWDDLYHQHIIIQSTTHLFALAQYWCCNAFASAFLCSGTRFCKCCKCLVRMMLLLFPLLPQFHSALDSFFHIFPFPLP